MARLSLSAIAVAGLAAAAGWGQEGAPVFSTTAELVLVDAQVVHKKTGTSAPALSKDDFEVLEDGVRQEIAFFSRDELPLSIVLLFDTTQTVRPVLRRLGGAARAALDHLKPDDEVAVMSCQATARLIDGFTTDRARTAGAIDRLVTQRWKGPGQAAFFNQDVYKAAEQALKSTQPSSRRVIIWLTDNLPNAPTESNRAGFGWSVPPGQLHTEAQAVQKLHEAGIVVSPMLLTDPMWDAVFTLSRALNPFGNNEKTNPRGDARKYAEITGGEVFPASRQNIAARLADLIDSLRSRYTIGYRPSESKPPGAFCKLSVALTSHAPLRPQDWSVLARAGYYRPAQLVTETGPPAQK